MRMPTHNTLRTTYASVRMRGRARGMRVCGFCGICGRSVLVLFPGLVMVSLFPVFDLSLQRLGGDAGRVVEHQTATEHASPHESQDADDAQRARQGQLLRGHLEAAGEAPD